MEESIYHFSHGSHAMKLVHEARPKTQSYTCYGCGFTYSAAGTPIYACKSLSYKSCTRKTYLCILCAQLPYKIWDYHPTHSHRLELEISGHKFGNTYCSACNEKMISYHALVYRCSDCYFCLHVHCVYSLKTAIKSDAHSHHRLNLIDSRIVDSKWSCSSCHSCLVEGVPFAGCLDCNRKYHFNCHQSTEDQILPGSIEYFWHEHPLSLVTLTTYTIDDSKYFHSCEVCEYPGWPEQRVYSCLECKKCTLHLACAIQESSFSWMLQIRSHILLILESDASTYSCEICKKPILQGQRVFGCQECKFFLDEPCMDKFQALDKKTHHFHHPEHTLRLELYLNKELFCSCCSRGCRGFVFRCERCPKFVLDLECVLLEPSIKSRDHRDHLLVALETRKECPRTFYLRCVKCQINFNFTNCPLPQTVDHKCHFHTLTLKHRLVENGEEEQSYCDACEERRDPDDCLYYCAGCKFEAHVGCVIPYEDLCALSDKFKDVKLITSNEIEEHEEKADKKAGRDVALLTDVLLPLNQQEVEKINNILSSAANITWENFTGESVLPSRDTTKNTLFSDEPFTTFVNKLSSIFSLKEAREMMLSFIKKKNEVVRVGEYMVPLDFEPILKDLLGKHGDVCAECTLDPKMKQFFFLLFCIVVQNMCDTKVTDVTEKLLFEWWICFTTVQAAGFKILFAFKSFKRLVYAHFGLRADKCADATLTNVRKEMKDGTMKVYGLTKQLVALTEQLQEDKERLERLRIEEMELREAIYRTKKSSLMRKCLTEMEELVCDFAGEDLLR